MRHFLEDFFWSILKVCGWVPPIAVHPDTTVSYRRDLRQAIANGTVILPNHHRGWPQWTRAQWGVDSPLFQPVGIGGLCANVTSRAWTRLGALHSPLQVRVDDEGRIMPSDAGWSCELWIRLGEGAPVPLSSLASLKQWMDTQSTTVITSGNIGGVEVKSTVFFKGYRHHESLAYTSVSVHNKSAQVQDVSAFWVIRPYNSLGISPISRVDYLSSASVMVNGQLGMVLDALPHNVVATRFEAGEVMDTVGAWQMILSAKCPRHLASMAIEYRYHLLPNASDQSTAKLSLSPTTRTGAFFNSSVLSQKAQAQLAKQIALLTQFNYASEWELLKEDQESTQPLWSVTVSDQAVNRLFQLSGLHLKSLFSSSLPVRDQVAILRGLLMCGHVAFVTTQLGQLRYPDSSSDGACDAMILLKELYDFTHDKLVLDTLYLPLLKVLKKCYTLQKGSKDVLGYGLLTPRYGVDVLGGKDQYLWDSIVMLEALKSAHQLGSVLHLESASMAWISKSLTVLRSHFDQFLHALSHRLKISHLATSATRFTDCMMIYSLASVPFGLLEMDDPRVTETLRLIYAQYVTPKGVCNPGHFGGINPLHTLMLSRIELERAQTASALDLFARATQLASPTGCFAQHVHPTSLKGSFGDAHDGRTSSEWVRVLRRMLITESQDTIHLLPAVPKHWLSTENASITVRHLMTSFGVISFTLTRLSDHFSLSLDADYHTQPLAIKIHFPCDITRISIDDLRDKPVTGSVVSLPSPTRLALLYFI